MAKSKGNFYTIEDILKLFGADATRIGFADAGDTHEDSNFLTEICNKSILRLYAFENWFNDVVSKDDNFREDEHI